MVKGPHVMCDLDPYLTNPLTFVNAPSAGRDTTSFTENVMRQQKTESISFSPSIKINRTN